jgi:hypothetical protein
MENTLLSAAIGLVGGLIVGVIGYYLFEIFVNKGE